MEKLFCRATALMAAGIFLLLGSVIGGHAADPVQRVPGQRMMRAPQAAPVNQPTPQLVSVSKAAPNRASVAPGGSVTVTLTGTGLDRVTSAQAGPGGLPANTVTASLGPGSSSSRPLILKAGPAVPPGDYTVRLTIAQGQLMVLPGTVLTVVVTGAVSRTPTPSGIRVLGSTSSPSEPITLSSGSLQRSPSTEQGSSTAAPLSGDLENRSLRQENLENRATADVRQSALAERVERVQQQQGVARTLPGSADQNLPEQPGSGTSLSSRLGDDRPALLRNPALAEGGDDRLGQDLEFDRGMGDLVAGADKFRSAAQTPGSTAALNPAKGELPNQTGFTMDPRLASGGDAGNTPAPAASPNPAPAGTPKPDEPGSGSDGKGSKTLVKAFIKRSATEEEKAALESKLKKEFPDAEIRIFRGEADRQTMKNLLGKAWSKVSDGGDRYEIKVPNATTGVRGQCPPESMICGLTGKTWDQLSHGERKRFCDEFESELDKYRSGGSSGATACDADNLREPSWGEIMASGLGPLILTDEEGDSGIVAPVRGEEPFTRGDLAGSLPDPVEPGAQVQPEIPGKDPSGGPGTGGH